MDTASTTLPAVWASNATTFPDRLAVSHWSDGGITHRYTWRELFVEARRVAHWLQDAGVRPGQVCALVLQPTPEFFPLYMGVVLVGALPSVMAYPNERLHPQKFRDGLRGMATMSGLDWLLSDAVLLERFAGILDETRTRVAVVNEAPWREFVPLPSEQLHRPAPDDACLLQHSSGTTGLQKGVALSHFAVLEHARRYGTAIDLQASDSVASWLPLYHDMGLIAAFHVPLAHALPLVQLDAFAWVVRPVELLLAMHHEQSTLCWLPNFAFNLMADRIRNSDIPVNACQSVRLITSCSEPVRASSLQRMRDKLAPYGLKSTALGASFAMAETTFAVTQTPAGTEPVVERVARSAIAAGSAVPSELADGTRDCVSSGQAIPGCRVQVVDNGGEMVADGVLGNIEVQSVSLFNGYRHNEQATARAFRGNWFVTGDIGYVRNGELFVLGREKDLIIVAGKNIYPEDVEDAVSRVPGVTAGRVVAFEVDDEQRGTGQIGVVVETGETELPVLRALRAEVARVGTDFDVPINHIYFAEPRWLIKSSSGKLSRRDNASRALSELEDVIWKTS